MDELICKKYKKTLRDLLKEKKVSDADIAILLEKVGTEDALVAMREIVTGAAVILQEQPGDKYHFVDYFRFTKFNRSMPMEKKMQYVGHGKHISDDHGTLVDAVTLYILQHRPIDLTLAKYVYVQERSGMLAMQNTQRRFPNSAHYVHFLVRNLLEGVQKQADMLAARLQESHDAKQ